MLIDILILVVGFVLGRLFGLFGIHSAMKKELSESPLSEEEKDERVPTTLNQRLDKMGPSYRAIFGRLTRALAIIESAASTKPPRMTPNQFEVAIDCLAASTAELKDAAKKSEH